MSIEFPILDSGLIAQIPMDLQISKEIIHNRFRDGAILTNSTSSRTKYSWAWTYSNLSPSEMTRVVEFWEETGRGAKAFRFYDPLGNLLKQSEDLVSPYWLKVGQIDVVEIDPLEGHRQYLLTNSGDLPAELHQSVQVDAAASLVLSLKARWDGSSSVALACEAGTSLVSGDFLVDTYKMCELSIKSGTQSSIRKISIRVPGHTQIIVSEPQLEVGLKRGSYLTSTEGGVFDAAWIDPNSFRLWSTAPGCYSIYINVISFR
jgi:hypothetical protein